MGEIIVVSKVLAPRTPATLWGERILLLQLHNYDLYVLDHTFVLRVVSTDGGHSRAARTDCPRIT